MSWQTFPALVSQNTFHEFDLQKQWSINNNQSVPYATCRSAINNNNNNNNTETDFNNQMVTFSCFDNLNDIISDYQPMVELDPEELNTFISEEANEDQKFKICESLSPSNDYSSSSEFSPEPFYKTVFSRSTSVSPTACPSISPYPGKYGFEVSVEQQLKKTKQANWVFEEGMDVLFVKDKAPIPFLFRTHMRPPPGSFIRCTAVFYSADVRNEIPQRCANHSISFNEPPAKRRHLITSDHLLAQHVEDVISRRLSAIVPHEEPQVGSSWTTNLFTFPCWSSCHKKQGPLHAVFTLESDNQVHGRQVVKIHSCACPARDAHNKKEAIGRKTNCPKRRSMLSVKSQPAQQQLQPPPLPAKVPRLENEVFSLQVRGRENYELLCRLRDSLDLLSRIPNDLRQKYLMSS